LTYSSLSCLLLLGCESEEAATTTEATMPTEAETAVGSEEVQSAEDGPAPSVTAANSIVQLSGDTKVVLIGAGFEPGQEIHLLVTTDQDGIQAESDLTYAGDPEPVANAKGAWGTSCGAFDRWFVGKGWITEGVYSIVATDADGNRLATTSVALYAPEKPDDNWPAWAKIELSE